MSEQKKEKTDAKKRKKVDEVVDEEEEDAGDEEATPTSVQLNDDGEPYFELAPMRRLSLRKFKGKILIDIREYYGDKDKPKPTKKGISLSVEQFKRLSDLIKSDEVDEELCKLEHS